MILLFRKQPRNSFYPYNTTRSMTSFSLAKNDIQVNQIRATCNLSNRNCISIGIKGTACLVKA